MAKEEEGEAVAVAAYSWRVNMTTKERMEMQRVRRYLQSSIASGINSNKAT
jgi:hypothetical protein